MGRNCGCDGDGFLHLADVGNASMCPGNSRTSGQEQMASAKDELAALKIRAGKGQGQARVTLINHTAHTSVTCSIVEGVNILALLVEKGQSNNSIHIVDHAAEKERKLTNPKGTTRRVFNCRTAEQWTEFNKVLERYYDEAVDPHIAIDLIIKALGAFSPETIRGWANQVEEPTADQALDETPLPSFLQD